MSSTGIFENQSNDPPLQADELRWTKADAGTAITYSYNDANNPGPHTAAQMVSEIKEAAELMATVVDITFTQLPNGTPSDIEFIWDTVGDGVGGVLAFVYQPVGNPNMAACGVCGDLNADTSDFPFMSLSDVFNVTLHEMGHSIGLAHTPDLTPPVPTGSNVMDPFYSFGTPKFRFGRSDLDEMQQRYPFT